MPLTSGIIKLAIKEAEASPLFVKCKNIRERVGAVIFKQSRIISSGHNDLKDNNLNMHYRQPEENSVHAEEVACINHGSLRDLKGSSILVVRINKRSELRLARPCDNCMNILRTLKFKDIYYSTNTGSILHEKL